jgi:hypothetical protein
MKKIILCLITTFGLTFSECLGQEKLLVLGSSNFNSKTIGIYQNQIEKLGGKVIESFLGNEHRLIFVSINENQIQAEKLIQILSNNELQHPIYIKHVQNSSELKSLGVNSSKIFSYYDNQEQKPNNKQVDQPKEYEKDGKKFVKCEWAPFYYEVTGGVLIKR